MANSVADVSVGFRPAWCLHTNRDQCGKNLFVHLSCISKIAVTWISAESPYFLSFPRFWTLSIEWFWFWFIFILVYFEWRDTANQQYSNYMLNDVPAVFCEDNSLFQWNSHRLVVRYFGGNFEYNPSLCASRYLFLCNAVLQRQLQNTDCIYFQVS